MKKIIILLSILATNTFANSGKTAMQNIGSYFEIPVLDLNRAMKFYFTYPEYESVSLYCLRGT